MEAERNKSSKESSIRAKRESGKGTKRKGFPKNNLAEKVFSPSKTIVGAAALMMFAILLTKVFGFLRIALMGSSIPTAELDLFNAANAIPEVVFNIIALGSINAAIIPIITKIFNTEGEGQERVNKVLSSVIQLGLVLFIICGVLVFFFSDFITHLFVGFDGSRHFDADQFQKISFMIKILIFSPVILALSSVLASLFQIKRKFFITQLAPLFYNLGIIISVYTFVPWMGGNPIGLCYGVLLGSVLHLACELPGFIGTGYKFKFGHIDFKDKYLQKIGTLMVPRSLGLAAEQAGFIVQTGIALNLYSGSLTIYKFAMSLRDIPISIFGLTLAQAVFPSLSEDANRKTFDEFNRKLQYVFQQILFLVIPATIILIVLRLPIARSTFGIFGHEITLDTISRIAWVLMFLSLTIVFQALLNLLVRAFYALSNTTIPFLTSLGVIILEVALSFVFTGVISNNFHNDIGAVAGLALASTISNALGVGILMFFLHHKTKFINMSLIMSILKKILSGGLMAISILAVYKFLEIFEISRTTLGLLFVLLVSVTIGLCSYLTSEYNLKDDDMKLSAKFFGGFKSALKFVLGKREIQTVRVGNSISNLN